MTPIDIALCIDEGMLGPALVSLYSIAETMDPDRHVRVFVVMSGNPGLAETMAPMLERSNFEIVVKCVENPYQLFPDNSYISAATYLRFLLPDLLDVDRVLYLDADLIATRCLGPLFDTELGGHAVAAVPDLAMSLGSRYQPGFKLFRDGTTYTFAAYIKSVVGLVRPGEDGYFNAGVMLIDLAAWRRSGFVAAVLRFLQANDGLSFLDQDGLNHVCAGRYRALDPRWNSVVGATTTMPTRWVDRLWPRSRRWAEICSLWMTDPWIIHFAGPTKPWTRTGSGMPMDAVWWSYARRSPAASMFAKTPA